MKKRSFRQLKKNMTYEEFNEFCKKIANEYANSESNFARSYFCNYYEIGESCFYRVLEYAIITNLVDDKLFKKMMEKSITNQISHKAGAGMTSVAKYNHLYSKRCEYIALSFPENKIKQIAEDFANNPNVSKEDIALKYNISRKVLELMLERSIIDNVVNDEIFEAIRNRSIKNSTPNKKTETEKYFEVLQEKRKNNKGGIDT